jgi:hypothetical protein
MDNFSGVQLFHFFLILLRNFDSILRPFFPVQLNCNTRGSSAAFPPTSSNDQTTPWSFSDCTSTRQINSLKFTCFFSLSTHGSFLAQVQYSRFSILTVFNTHGFLLYFQRLHSNLFRLHQHQTNQLAQICLHSSTHGSSLHKFDIHGFQHSRFLLYFQRLQTLKQHALSDCISTRQIIKFALLYPRLLHCTSPIPTVSPPASQNISNASINSTALFQTASWIKTEIISLHPMEHNSQLIRLSLRFQNFTASLNSFHDFFNSNPHPTDSFFFLSAALIFVKKNFTPNGTHNSQLIRLFSVSNSRLR